MPTCEICDVSLYEEFGINFYTSLDFIYKSEMFWKTVFSGKYAHLHNIDPTGSSLQKFILEKTNMAHAGFICDTCHSIVSSPFKNSSGPVSEEEIAKAAANAWYGLYGTWPSSLKFREAKPATAPVATPPIPKTLTNISDQACWYCQAKRPADGVPYKVVLFKLDGKSRSEHHIYVPRCATCQAIHKKQTPYMSRIVPIMVFGSMALCPLVGFLTAKPLGGWSWALGAGIGMAGIGAVILITLMMTKASGTMTEASANSEVLEVKQMKAQGWTVDSAKSRTASPDEIGFSQPPAIQELPAIFETPVVEVPIPAEIGSEYAELSRDIAVKEGKILCGKCGKPILTIAEVQDKYSGYQSGAGQLVMGSMETFFQREADKNAIGVTCAACGHHFCVECMNKHGKAHPASGGMGCLDCGGRMKDFSRPMTG